ncbi:hypothetical protein [Mesobacillus boroniphilus]|nr:hypothetical protein [Mesobacillus boroniphilus]
MEKIKEKHRVVIVGGGPGGKEAASFLTLRAQSDAFEKTASLEANLTLNRSALKYTALLKNKALFSNFVAIDYKIGVNELFFFPK